MNKKLTVAVILITISLIACNTVTNQTPTVAPTSIVEASATPTVTLDEYLATIYPEDDATPAPTPVEMEEAVSFWNGSFLPKFRNAAHAILASADKDYGNNDGIESPEEIEAWYSDVNQKIAEYESLDEVARNISPEMYNAWAYYQEMLRHQADRVRAMRLGEEYESKLNQYGVDVLTALRNRYGVQLQLP